jgi:hypothetical protein
MPFGRRSKCFFTSSAIFSSETLPVPLRRDPHRGRLGDADGVGNLHQALAGKPGGDDVLRHVAAGVGGRAVDLRRVLAGEGAAAVGRRAAVGVDDDLAPGQAAVALRAADDEAAGGVDQVLDLALDQLLRQHRLDDVLDHRFARSSAVDMSGACWVESTTVSIECGLPST